MKLTIEKTKDFVRKSIDNSNRPNYPFRSRYRHTLRVLMWAERLQKELGGELEVLQYSALLHDCDWNGKENHAITSYNKAKEFLNQFDITDEFKRKVLECVRYHNEQGTTGLSKEAYILMDADELDEIGAVCIMWDTLAEQHENKEVSYKSVLNRTKKYMPKLHQNINKLNFEYTKAIYKKKLAFHQSFIDEAEEELAIELD